MTAKAITYWTAGEASIPSLDSKGPVSLLERAGRAGFPQAPGDTRCSPSAATARGQEAAQSGKSRWNTPFCDPDQRRAACGCAGARHNP